MSVTLYDRLIEARQPLKRQKRHHHSRAMSHLAIPQFLAAPTHHTRRRAGTITPLSRPRDDVDSFLSSDLELSLANTSLNSPPQEPIALTPDTEYDVAPMDISPSPPKTLFGVHAAAADKSHDDNPFKPVTRPRAFTSAARIFGGDMSNGSMNGGRTGSINGSVKSGASSAKRTQRAGLPMEWLHPTTKENTEPSSPGYDAMDVDMSFEVIPPSASTQTTFIPAPLPTASSVDTFKNLFFDPMSPASAQSPGIPQHKKRRSCSPESHKFDENDSSPAQPSPSDGRLRRVPSGPLLSRMAKPALQGLGGPPSNATKRPRRPVLSAMVQPTDSLRALSAYPALDNEKESAVKPTKNLPPPRRAFSALISSSNLLDQSSEDSSFEGFDQSSPAQAYSRRQQQRTIRRCDGTEDFKPITGATKVGMQESPSAKFLSAGIPGFGDNEAAGKILPCHRVADDGLMRIKPNTLDDLLDGKFDNKINNYYVIDCRFDYEYNGGHIEGAININSTSRLEQELLGLLRPKPTVSGDNVKQTVLVFHCEFSAKRAPTFAKHLRQKDRAMNNHNYPRIHYPELYILEGGYSEYFRTSTSHRKPTSYTPMDDPAHAASRREDLDQFRKAKFGRHKSYAYGDAMNKAPTALKPAPQLKRNTAPSGPPSMFAAANAARTRRSGSGGSGKGAGLHTLAEDGNTTAAEETDVDIGDSPCPPPSKATMLKVRKPRTLSRAETYGPGRMPLQY